MSFGTYIRRRRESLGLTQRQVADACDMNFQHLSRAETERSTFTPKRLRLLAKALMIPHSALIEIFADTKKQEIIERYSR